MVELKNKGNTKIYQTHEHGEDFTVVRLHSSDIVKFNDSRVILDADGWYTVTTKQRMNQAAREYNLGFWVYQKDRVWYLGCAEDCHDPKPHFHPYYDGMSIPRR